VEDQSAFTCASAAAEQVAGLLASLEGKDEPLERSDAPPVVPADTDGDPRELLVAGRGLRLVIKSRYLPERWALANAFFRRVGS
jgi:hypothetical protein